MCLKIGTTLKFYNNEEEAYNNKDSEEHYYGDISKENKWTNKLSKEDKEKIEKVIIVSEIEPINMSNFFDGLKNLKQIENIKQRTKEKNMMCPETKRLLGQFLQGRMIEEVIEWKGEKYDYS